MKTQRTNERGERTHIQFGGDRILEDTSWLELLNTNVQP